MQVSVAHTRVLNLHERLTVTDSRNGNLTDNNRTVNLLRNNNSLHGFLAHDLKLLSHWLPRSDPIPSGAGARILYISTVK